LSTVEEIESNVSQSQSFRNSKRTITSSSLSKFSGLKNNWGSAAKNKKKTSNFENQQSSSSPLSNNDLMQQLLCQETIPVSEEDIDSEHDEVFMRVQRANPSMTNLLYQTKG